jgi:hypothetical protein
LNLVDGYLQTEDGSGAQKAKVLHIAEGATINIDASMSGLNDVPEFDGLMNVVYKTAGGNTGKELPTTTVNKLNDMTVSVATTLKANAIVNGTLTLDNGVLTTTGKTLTLATGATIVDDGGDISDAPAVTTTYDLTYTANASDAKEFISGKIDTLTVKEAKLTLQGNKTVANISLVEADVTNEIGLNGKELKVTGNVDMSNGVISNSVSTSGSLVLGGTTPQVFKVPASGVTTLDADLKLDNAAGFTLQGGDLKIGKDIIFINGVLTTDKTVQLTQSPTGPGFNHNGVVYPNVSHINGKVSHFIRSGAGTPTAINPNGRFEYPVGTATNFRPYIITFSSTYPAINPTNVVVSMVTGAPGGSPKDFPISVDSVKIGGFPNYYWLVDADPSSFSSTQLFDVEMHGTNLGVHYTSDQTLRIIRRQDGESQSNHWSAQQGSTYANYSVYYSANDTTAVVRTTASIGGIVSDGTRFAIGVPTRVPEFTAPTVLTASVEEGDTLKVQVTANPNDVGETITYSLVDAPLWAKIDANGLLQLTPGFEVGRAAAYEIVVKALDSGGNSATLTLTVTVVDANRAPSFTAPGASYTAKDTVDVKQALTLTYVAIDADGTTPIYSYTVDPTPAGTVSMAAGVLTYTPAVADAAKNFTFSVAAVDASTFGDTVATVVTVAYGREKGDVDGNKVINSLDAPPVLQYAVGKGDLSKDALGLWAADCNNNGAGDGTVNAFDAAFILYRSVYPTWPVAKAAAVAGNAVFGKFTNANGVMRVPLTLQNTKGVLSLYSEVNLGSNIDFKGMKTNLPEGWQIASNLVDGTLKIAMCGLNPLTDGNVVVLELGLKNQESVVTIQGSINLNDAAASTLQPVNVREIPTDFSLSQNYPNPFNPTTNIKYAIPQDANVSLVVYNMLGQAVKTLVNEEQQAGYYTTRWDGTNNYGSKVASGIYIYRISAGNYTHTIKMNLIK